MIATHLSNQNYEICFRRNNNYCAICYTVAITGANTPADQGSFGLSETQDTAGQADNTLEALVQQENQACDEDFVVVSCTYVSSLEWTIKKYLFSCNKKRFPMLSVQLP